MKQIYFLLIAIIGCVGITHAQFTDDLDSYTTGDISPQSDMWRTWSGNDGAENGEVTTEQASSSPNSMKIGAGQGPQDQLLLFSNQPTDGVWDIEFKMYVPTDNSGYFNIQGEITTPQAGSFLSTDIYFNQGNNSPGMGALGDTGITFSFPHDEWFTVITTVDMDGETYSMTINDEEAIPVGTSFNAGVPYLGGVDFFATEPEHTCYFDDIEFRDSNLGLSENDKESLILFPNPSKDIVTIKNLNLIEEVQVIDILGKVVLQKITNQVNPTLDIQELAAGTYIIQIQSGDSVQSTKLIKQ